MVTKYCTARAPALDLEPDNAATIAACIETDDTTAPAFAMSSLDAEMGPELFVGESHAVDKPHL